MFTHCAITNLYDTIKVFISIHKICIQNIINSVAWRGVIEGINPPTSQKSYKKNCSVFILPHMLHKN